MHNEIESSEVNEVSQLLVEEDRTEAFALMCYTTTVAEQGSSWQIRGNRPASQPLFKHYRLEAEDPKHRFGDYLYYLKKEYKRLKKEYERVPGRNLPTFHSWVDVVNVFDGVLPGVAKHV